MRHGRSTGRDLTVTHDGIVLSGSAWLPAHEPTTGVLMIPGSGPATRDNDGLFPPIREHLVASGAVVASFDKRGVGRSSGDWTTASLDDLATDVVALLDALAREVPIASPFGLFGHSQGGWVALAAAARTEVPFVVTNSGPGVSVSVQIRFDIANALRRSGASQDAQRMALAVHDDAIRALRLGRRCERLAQIAADPEAAPQIRLLDRAGHTWPDAREWCFLRRIIDHDPAGSLRQLRTPVLALFGAEDRLVPVDRSIEALERRIPERRWLTSRVFPEADHRMRHGDPPRFVPGYLDELTSWIMAAQHGGAEFAGAH